MTIRLTTAILIVLMVVAISLNGCVRHTSDILLAEVGPERIYVSDYERMLAKNNGGWEAAKKTPLSEKEKFLDLLVKYRLKVLDAYRHGFDRDPDFSQEMQDYAKGLAVTFLLEREMVGPALRRMYNRRKEELRASHILIRLAPEATPEDTFRAWEKAAALIQRAQSGEDFGQLAAEYSDDYSTKAKEGDVYYLTSGVMAPTFEDACYQLQPGEVFPHPVRTEHGYHVINVTDRKTNRGQIRASHIMIRFEASSPSPEDTLKAYRKIKEIQASLLAGKDFADLAIDYSEDLTSALRGGDIGFFERRRAIQPFDEAAYRLKVGDVSGIVRTPYGYHLIRVTAEKPVPPFSEIKDKLRETYQNSRYTYDYENLLRRFKTELNFTTHPAAVDVLLARADSTKVFSDETWDQEVSTTDRQTSIFTFATETVKVDSVISLMKEDVEFRNMQLKPANIFGALHRIAERSLIQYKTRRIDSEFPEFKRTLKEYEEGILLYRSEQQQVWSKIVTNDSLLLDYFEKNRERYQHPHRVSFTEVFLLGDSAQALQLLDSLKAGADIGDLAIEHSDRPRVEHHKGEWLQRAADENTLTRKAATMKVGEISEPIRFEGGYSIIKVLANEPARLKTYGEASSEVAGHYHDYVSRHLEEEWLNALRQEFKVVVQPENLQAAFSRAPQEKEE